MGSSLSPDQTKALQGLLMQNANVLSDLPGRTNTVQSHVTLRDGKGPIRHSYELLHALEPQFQQEVSRWLELGIVEPSSSPYCPPLIAVRKKDGTHRFCLDCRQLNLITVPDLEPIADQAHIFTKLSSAKYLSKLDLASGFWQIGLSEATRPMTAFRTRSGHFQFRVMSFGMTNAPACFSRLMRAVIRDLHNTEVLDDVLVYSETFDEHLQCLRKLFERLQEHGLHA